jgi:DNA-binding IclR family transcriptional regulator
MASDVPAVGTAMRILESLAAASPAAVLPGQLVNELKVNRSTCYNILAALQRGGWARSLGDRAGWTLGPRLLALANGTSGLVMTIMQQELDRLNDEIGFVVFVSERGWTGDHLVIAKAERQTGVRVTVGVGDTFPFSAPALMQALCAWLPSEERERLFAQHDLVPFTANTVVNSRALEEVLGAVRKDGFSRSIEQFKLGQSGVAAPIFDHRGRVDRVVCCLAFSSDLPAENAAAVGQAIGSCAERITHRTGGVAPADAPVQERTG